MTDNCQVRPCDEKKLSYRNQPVWDNEQEAFMKLRTG